MTTVVQVAEDIYRIDVGPIKKAGSSGYVSFYSLVYLIVSDGETAIIDTSPACGSSDVLEAIRNLGHNPARLSHIILTHIHLDHAGGVGALAQQFPGIRVVVHKRGAPHIIKPDMLIEGTRQAYGNNFEKDYGPITPVPKNQVLPVDEGDIIRVGRRELKILYTPGHASHHMSIYDSRSQGVFSGDSLGTLGRGNNTIIIVAGFDLSYALDSIDRMRALNPKRIYAGHGTDSREPIEFIQSVRTTTQDYGVIILESLKALEDKEKITQKLLDYHKKREPEGSGIDSRRFDDVIPWYTAYFKKKGLV